jgi:hypothetical protein
MTILDDDPLELDRVNHVGTLVLYSIQIIRLRISKLEKEKGLYQSIWITGFKPILCHMKFVIVLIFFRPPHNYHWPVPYT